MADEPMTDERLDEIRRLASRAEVSMMASSDVAVRDLLADVDRLRARESLLREMLDAASAVSESAMRRMVNHARALLAKE